MATKISSGLSDDEFVKTFLAVGPSATARITGQNSRSVLRRRAKLEHTRGKILSPLTAGGTSSNQYDYPEHIPLEIKNGILIVGSDAHIWPGPRSPAIRAFIHLVKELGPKAVVLNGDVMDFSRISRHAPIGWEKNPKPSEELEAAIDVLHDIEQAAGRVRKIWTLGNHDARFESHIAQHCPEYANIHGIHLRDHFPNWEPCWLVFVNDTVAIKHRYKGGMHATHNNALWSGRHMITGHLHSQRASPIADYDGVRYGVDTGCLANKYSAAFKNYTEENPRNWISGFGVFSFEDGIMLPPEFVTVVAQNKVAFRGKTIKV